MSNLTKAVIADAIHKAIVKAKFTERLAEAKQNFDTTLNEVLRESMGASLYDPLRDAFKLLRDSGYYGSFYESKIKFIPHGGANEWSFSHYYQAPNKIGYTGTAIPATAENVERLDAARRAVTNIESERKNLANHIETIFKAAKTRKRLLEMWPEAEELLPPEAAKNLPAVITKNEVAALNKVLGLPTEKAA